MANLSAHAVRDLVIDRLASGVYPLGSKLPTSRELAAEIGAHRNTVAKAYQELAALGLVTVRQGRGTFVVASLDEGNGRPVAAQVCDALANLVMKARRIGLPEHNLREMIDQQIASAYGSVRRGAFVECNTADVDAAIAEIETLTGFRLAPLLLRKLATDPVASVAGYDVVFTSLFHVKEVSERLALGPPDVVVIGIHTQPDETALREIAQIRPGSCVGIVVSNPEGARRFANQINTVAAVHTKALIMPTDDEIRRLAREVDIVVCSRSRVGQVAALGLPLPTIELTFHVSRQSARRVIDALMGPPPAAPEPAAAARSA